MTEFHTKRASCGPNTLPSLSTSARLPARLQVLHFDKLHDKKLRLLQTLQQNINRSTGSAKGVLQGEAQQ